MTEFGEFYARGGVFMHLVSLLSLVAAGMLASRAARLRGLVKRVASSGPLPDEGLFSALVVAALMMGVLGTTVGAMEVCLALRTIPPEQHGAAVVRAIPIALSPLAWTLILGAPLLLGRGVVGAIEARLALSR